MRQIYPLFQLTSVGGRVFIFCNAASRLPALRPNPSAHCPHGIFPGEFFTKNF